VQVTDTTSVLDHEQLRDITMCDKDLMREILTALIEDTSRQVQLLASAICRQDAQCCVRLAHYSKGACANVGANRAAALFQQLERNAAAGAFHQCRDDLQTLPGEIDLLRNEAVAQITGLRS
jgi:HPt (histidine-containing phosphotransfer) domain-containing protein